MRIPDRDSHRCLGLIVLVALAGSGQAARAASSADDQTVADRENSANLAKLIVARLDAAEEARVACAEAEVAVLRAKDALGEAERTRTIAQISIKEYLEGSFPQDRQTLLGEIELAQSELARAVDQLALSAIEREKGTASEKKLLADQMAKQKAEISLANSAKKMDVLEKFTKIKNTTNFEANRMKAEAEESRRQQSWQAAKTTLEKAERRLADEVLTANESLAIVRLDEAISLFDENKVEAARAKLMEAWKLCDEAVDARAKARYQAVKDRVRAEAKKARDGK